DEADPRRQERVRGELDHLRRRDARPHEGRLETLVERSHAIAVLVAGRSDHDPIWVPEVLDPAPLGEELRARDVADALAELGADPLAGSDRHGALHHERRAL